MFGQVKTLLESLQVNPSRALQEVNAEYSTTTELADVLQREADVPFRVGHHFASELVTFGREKGLGPRDLKFADVTRIWAEAGKKYDLKDAKFPLTEKRFRESLSAEGMIAAAKGLGGPQPAEVARMLAAQRRQLAADQAWLKATRDKLAKAQQDLDAAFKALAAGG
jgi:argininosuccinate lyase